MPVHKFCRRAGRSWTQFSVSAERSLYSSPHGHACFVLLQVLLNVKSSTTSSDPRFSEFLLFQHFFPYIMWSQARQQRPDRSDKDRDCIALIRFLCVSKHWCRPRQARSHHMLAMLKEAKFTFGSFLHKCGVSNTAPGLKWQNLCSTTAFEAHFLHDPENILENAFRKITWILFRENQICWMVIESGELYSYKAIFNFVDQIIHELNLGRLVKPSIKSVQICLICTL